MWRWFVFGLVVFGWVGARRRRRQQEAGETEQAIESDWELPSDMFAPDTQFQTGPAELVTQPMGDDVPQVPRPRR